MHVHLPKPLHGWREFAGEVGIIVIGVLIALGAEQVLERARWQREVGDARNTLDQDLTGTAYQALERIKFGHCISQQLNRIDELIRARNPAIPIYYPGAPIRPWPSASWDAAIASGAVAHMSQSERNAYATVFEYNKALTRWSTDEFDLASDLDALSQPRTLSPGERDHLIDAVSRLRNLNRIMAIASKQWLIHAEPLHLKIDAARIASLQKPSPCLSPERPPKS